MLAPFADIIREKSIKNPSKNRGIDFSSIFSIFHRFLIDFGPSKDHGPIGYPSFGANFGTILRSLWKIFKRNFGRSCRPTCLLELTFQIGNYLKKAEHFLKEHTPRCTRRTHHPFTFQTGNYLRNIDIFQRNSFR